MTLLVGDTVSKLNQGLTDGTVVDVISGASQYVKVYWRYPKGEVTQHYGTELVRRG